MACLNCNTEVDTAYETAFYPCGCGDSIKVEYHSCSICNSLWTTSNGDLVGEVDTMEMMHFNEFDQLHKDMLDKLIEIVQPTLDSMEDSMEDCVHRCIECNSLAYESALGKYSCTKCECVWEIEGL